MSVVERAACGKSVDLNLIAAAIESEACLPEIALIPHCIQQAGQDSSDVPSIIIAMDTPVAQCSPPVLVPRSSLLAKYPVPAFMDSAWFRGQTDEAARQQAWYKRLASGESPCRLDLPIPLTKRMAHHFLQAPKDCSVDAALRWIQVMGFGGDGRLAKAILGSCIASDFVENDFWETVIRWFIQHLMLDPAQVGPLIDYIYRRKFEPDFGFDTDGFEAHEIRTC